ncbi:MAG: metal-dependent hydrolase [Chitinophagaceae bacterium]|nr:metal-dependent hydrolase [Anaerolineae bacterium]
MSITFTWLGHSTFTFDIDGHSVLIDPFLTGNPLAAVSPDDLNPELMLISHGHGDHVADAVSIAKRTGALVLSNPEICGWLRREQVPNVWGVNTGGTYDAGFVRVKWTIAFHSSSLPDGSYGGNPLGMILKANGMNLYFAGDTALFSDMQLIGDEKIDVAFLPIGDNFTMGIDDSIKAIRFIRPRFVVPMHYNTFPPIAQNGGDWANRVNSETDAQPLVLDPGGSYTLG